MATLGDSCDFATEVAFLYPLEVIHDVIGIPREDHAQMLRLTQWLFTYADPDLCRPGANITDPAEIIKTWDIVYREFKDYYEDVIRARRACPSTASRPARASRICRRTGSARCAARPSPIFRCSMNSRKGS